MSDRATVTEQQERTFSPFKPWNQTEEKGEFDSIWKAVSCHLKLGKTQPFQARFRFKRSIYLKDNKGLTVVLSIIRW